MSAPVRTQSVRTGKPSGGNWTAKARSGTDSWAVAEASASWGPVTYSYLPSNIFISGPPIPPQKLLTRKAEQSDSFPFGPQVYPQTNEISVAWRFENNRVPNVFFDTGI